MKHFKLILASMRIIVGLLFAANVIFMMQLYNSIKERYISDVEQCLSRADQIELVDRIIDAGLGGDDDVVWVAIGLQKSDVGSTMNAEELRELDYSQGFRRVDKQIMSMIAQYLHGGSYADRIGEPDVSKMEEAFRRDLNFSGYYPEEVYIVAPGGTVEYSSDLWEIGYRINGDLTYYAIAHDIFRYSPQGAQKQAHTPIGSQFQVKMSCIACLYQLSIKHKDIGKARTSFVNRVNKNPENRTPYGYSINNSETDLSERNEPFSKKMSHIDSSGHDSVLVGQHSQTRFRVCLKCRRRIGGKAYRAFLASRTGKAA